MLKIWDQPHHLETENRSPPLLCRGTDSTGLSKSRRWSTLFKAYWYYFIDSSVWKVEKSLWKTSLYSWQCVKKMHVTTLKFSLSRSVKEYLGFLSWFHAPSKNHFQYLKPFLRGKKKAISKQYFTPIGLVSDQKKKKNSQNLLPECTCVNICLFSALVGDAPPYWRMPLSGKSSRIMHSLNSVVVSTGCSRKSNMSSSLKENTGNITWTQILMHNLYTLI